MTTISELTNRVIIEKSAWVNLEIAAEVRDALTAMGYCVGSGATNDGDIVLYLN